MIIEHEPEIVTTCGTFKKSQLAHAMAERKAAEADYYARLAEYQAKLPKLRNCPFRSNSMERLCRRNCALYHDGNCSLATGERSTDGGICPLSSTTKCSEACAVYGQNGCGFIQKNKE